jgi:hypothetical protein
LFVGSGFQGIPGTNTGKQEKEWHKPHIQPADKKQSHDTLLIIIQMPGAASKKPGTVKKEHG